jgi:hypothetical protein
MRGARGIAAVVVAVCLLLAGTARADAPPAAAPLLLPEAGVPGAAPVDPTALITGFRMRTAGIVLLAVGAAAVIAGVVPLSLERLALCGPVPASGEGYDRSQDYDRKCNTIRQSFTAVAAAGAGALVLPGAILVIVGQMRINRARAPSLAPVSQGPVGSHGLSLRWRF